MAVSLAANNPQVRVAAVDISDQALDMARKNSIRLKTSDRIDFISGDLLDPLAGSFFHLITANLPYVPRSAFLSTWSRRSEIMNLIWLWTVEMTDWI